MTMYEYPIICREDVGSWWSSCPDIPEAHSAGDSVEELLANVVEGITLALSIYVDQGRVIPAASTPEEDQPTVQLPAQTVAKIVLWNAMREKGMRVADLARTLGLSHPVANRLVDFEHNSKIEQIELALAALGKGVKVSPADPGWIDLPHGGAPAGFYAKRLADVFRDRGETEMVIGAIQQGLAEVKPYSLDYLLRTRYAKNPDTKQAVKAVIDALVESGLFVRGEMKDPITDKTVDCIALTHPY
jgi:antitoxin HicB